MEPECKESRKTDRTSGDEMNTVMFSLSSFFLAQIFSASYRFSYRKLPTLILICNCKSQVLKSHLTTKMPRYEMKNWTISKMLLPHTHTCMQIHCLWWRWPNTGFELLCQSSKLTSIAIQTAVEGAPRSFFLGGIARYLDAGTGYIL